MRPVTLLSDMWVVDVAKEEILPLQREDRRSMGSPTDQIGACVDSGCEGSMRIGEDERRMTECGLARSDGNSTREPLSPRKALEYPVYAPRTRRVLWRSRLEGDHCRPLCGGKDADQGLAPLGSLPMSSPSQPLA